MEKPPQKKDHELSHLRRYLQEGPVLNKFNLASVQWASLVAQTLKSLPVMQETRVQSERFPGEGNGNPLQYSGLENPMDGGAWWATVHRVAKSWTRLSDYPTLTESFCCIPEADTTLQINYTSI